MFWLGRKNSKNIEDRRTSVKRSAIIFGVFSIFMNFIVSAVDSLFLSLAEKQSSLNHEYKAFLEVILKDTEDVWAKIFAQQYKVYQEKTDDYPEPTLVLFSGRTSSPCGPATTGSGPFYCPADEKIYIDPAFYDVLANQLGAKGDFAQAYVIAHEVAHHVQKVTGRIPQVDAYRRRVSKAEANQATVRLELQADCYSGVWTNKVRSVLEEGDIKEALNAAFQIGDDTLQGRNGGHVNPASFTHGTSEQRVSWFFKGLKAGDVQACDTFRTVYDLL